MHVYLFINWSGGFRGLPTLVGGWWKGGQTKMEPKATRQETAEGKSNGRQREAKTTEPKCIYLS
jgi:hypothetical protein